MNNESQPVPMDSPAVDSLAGAINRLAASREHANEIAIADAASCESFRNYIKGVAGEFVPVLRGCFGISNGAGGMSRSSGNMGEPAASGDTDGTAPLDFAGAAKLAGIKSGIPGGMGPTNSAVESGPVVPPAVGGCPECGSGAAGLCTQGACSSRWHAKRQANSLADSINGTNPAVHS